MRKIFLFNFNFNFWLHCAACGILVPQPGIEPVPPALEVQSLNHWTAREVPHEKSLDKRCQAHGGGYEFSKILILV